MEESIEKWILNDDGLADKYYEDYVKAPDKAKWWISHRGEFRQYPGYKQVNQKVSVQPLKDRLVKSLDEEDWKEAPIAYKRDVAKELGTTVEKLDDAWNEHLEEVRKSNEMQARKDEVENWPWYKKAIASEYAKQRYINEPEASIFSDKGEWYNKGEDISDLLYGGAAAVGDFLPGVGGTVVGPLVRGMRDAQHKGVLPFTEESKYQKEWGDIAGDVGTDLMFNVSTDWLPTALLKRGSRVGRNAAKESTGVGDKLSNAVGDKLRKVEDYLKSKNAQKSIDDSVEQITKNTNAIDDPIQFHKEVSKMPEGPMKRDLESIDNNPLATSNDRFDAVLDWGIEYNRNKKGLDANDLFENGQITKELQDVRPSVLAAEKQRVVGNTGVDAATKVLGAGADAWKTFGERGVKEGKTIVGRGSKPKEQEQNKFDRWERGYATWDEKKSKEYKDWEDAHLKTILGLE